MIAFHIAFLLLIVLDAFVSAQQLSLDLHKVPNWLKRILIYGFLFTLLISSGDFDSQLIGLILFNLFLTWLTLYNGLYNQFRGLHWFLPQKTNPIERVFAKNSSLELYLKQAFLHIFGWTAIILEVLIILQKGPFA